MKQINQKKTKNKLLQKRNVVKEIDERLISIFREHIGKENMIGLDDVFVEVFNYDMNDVPFKRYFWKDFILKRIRLLRRTGRCFITCQNGGYFVLKTQDEADCYKDILKREIKAIKGSLEKADLWVEKELWKRI